MDLAEFLIDLFLILVSYGAGAVTIAFMDKEKAHKASDDAFEIGYAKGVEAENERIGKLLDKYADDLEKGSGEKKAK